MPQQLGDSSSAISGDGSSTLDLPLEMEDVGDWGFEGRVLGRLFGDEDWRRVAMAIEKLGLAMAEL